MTDTWVRTYERDLDYIESLGGIDWHEAEVPAPWHKCIPQTRGWMGLNYVERCACGAIRDRKSGPWSERNQTRKSRTQARRDAKAPKETVGCRSCGEQYEAIKGSQQAREHLCNNCWADELVAVYGGGLR